MAIRFEIERKVNDFYVKADGGDRDFVGRMTRYHDKPGGEDFVGLYNVPIALLPSLMYAADDARPAFGFWADFIAPTAKCEGGNFLTLNTYDRARFTWGFTQFAAHVPDGDFIRFFRAMLARPEAADYFADLTLVNGRIARLQAGGAVPLESAQSTAPLLDYLNPTTKAVEDAEVIAAGKLIHWTTHHAEARDLQTSHMAENFRGLAKHADVRLGLDGKTADLCCVICDILHQGRATFAAMQAALGAPNPLEGLLKLGSIAYPDRIKTLRKAIAAQAGLFGAKTWSRSKADFV